MNNTKNLYLIVLMFLGFMLYTQWQKDYATPVDATQESTSSAVSTIDQDIPETTTPSQSDDIPTPSSTPVQVNNQLPTQESAAANIITEVETPLLKLKFAEQGAALVYVELKAYPLKKNESKNVVLMDYQQNPYQAESGLVSRAVNFSHLEKFVAAQSNVVVNSEATAIRFTLEKAEGTLVKTYTIKPDGYDIQLQQTISNNTGSDWAMEDYQQLKRNNPWVNFEPSFTDASKYSFRGVGYFDSEEGYETKDFEDLQEQNLNLRLGQDAWIAMVQHYFFAGIIPPTDTIKVESKYNPSLPHPYLVRYVTPAKTVPAGGQTTFDATWYVGPKLQNEVPQVAKGLDLTVDYGVFTAISKPLFWVLEKIHSVVGNWGWAIVLLTILIKLLFFKLSEAQYKSMARMRKLQPRIAVLKERYKDDKPKFNQEMMGLYQKEKVNPLGGCLPILIQIPVFLALYWVLLESVELRQAPFILWLQDLSTPDPYFILPAINAAAMIMTQRLSPTPGMDPMQQKIMKIMPVAFSFMFAFFQSGLVLYWAVNSVLSLAQQWVITKRIDAQDDRSAS